MVEGLSNILQCDANEAVRIAIYELVTSEPSNIRTQESGSGAETRNKKFSLRVPGPEKNTILEMGEVLGVTPQTVVRTAVRWLAMGIRDESITRLTKSRKIGQTALAKKWKDENLGKSSETSIPGIREAQRRNGKLGALRKAQKESWDKAQSEGQERDTLIYEERGEWLKTHPMESKLLNNGIMDVPSIDVLMNLEAQDVMDQMTDEEKVDFYQHQFDGDKELAEAMVYQTQDDDDEWSQELEDEIASWL